jgi:hypothetical protein
MIVLKINQEGHVIQLKGIHPVRTPAKINITNFDLDYVQTELRKQGITSYEIKYTIEEQKPNIQTFTEKFTIIDTTPELAEIKSKLGNLESLLLKLVNRPETIIREISKEVEVSKERVKKIDQEELGFIPSIDSTISLSKEMETIQVKKEDISEENLSHIPKGSFKKSNNLD